MDYGQICIHVLYLNDTFKFLGMHIFLDITNLSHRWKKSHVCCCTNVLFTVKLQNSGPHTIFSPYVGHVSVMDNLSKTIIEHYICSGNTGKSTRTITMGLWRAQQKEKKMQTYKYKRIWILLLFYYERLSLLLRARWLYRKRVGIRGDARANMIGIKNRTTARTDFTDRYSGTRR